MHLFTPQEVLELKEQLRHHSEKMLCFKDCNYVEWPESHQDFHSRSYEHISPEHECTQRLRHLLRDDPGSPLYNKIMQEVCSCSQQTSEQTKGNTDYKTDTLVT